MLNIFKTLMPIFQIIIILDLKLTKSLRNNYIICFVSSLFFFRNILLTMCLSKYSNLEHLREVAVNLYSSEDHGNMNKLCERELAALINTFYQVRYSLYN